MRGKFTIVGIDPGTTVGLAFLDLKGNVIEVISGKEMSVNTVIEKILSYGYPAIIATDVESLPQTVEKIAASFDTKIFVPRTSISLKEKNEIAKVVHKVRNAHERDSLSAAIKAYQHYASKFGNIESRVDNRDLDINIDEIKALVLRGLSVSAAIEAVTPQQDDVKTEETHVAPIVQKQSSPLEVPMLKSRILKQRLYIDELESHIKKSAKKLHELRKLLDSYDEKVKLKAIKSKELKHKESRMRSLERELLKSRKHNDELVRTIKELRGQQTLQLQEKVLVCKVLGQFTKQSVMHVEATYGIRRGDILYVLDSSGGSTSTATILVEKGIKALIVSSGMSHKAIDMLTSNDIALIDQDNVPLLRVEDDYCVVDRRAFESQYVAWRSSHEKEISEKKKRWLEGLIDEYRYERKRDIK